MNNFPHTIIIRHRKENLKKCSLRGLERNNSINFYSYPNTVINENLSDYILLTMDAPILTADDNDKGLIIVDGTWKYAKKMVENIEGLRNCTKRSLPTHFKTAYPRKQTDCPDPEKGLASVEALYLAYYILNRPCKELLDYYFWRNNFLAINNLCQLK